MARKKKRARAYEAIGVLQELTELFERRRQQLAAEAGLSDLQWRVLEQVAAEGFMPSLFARRRSTDPAGVSRTLRQLLERSLIHVSIGRGDARRRVYGPTARGRRLLAAVRARREEAIAEVWLKLDEEELAAFAAAGAELAARLRAYAEGGSSPSRPGPGPRPGRRRESPGDGGPPLGPPLGRA